MTVEELCQFVLLELEKHEDLENESPVTMLIPTFDGIEHVEPVFEIVGSEIVIRERNEFDDEEESDTNGKAQSDG